MVPSNEGRSHLVHEINPGGNPLNVITGDPVESRELTLRIETSVEPNPFGEVDRNTRRVNTWTEDTHVLHGYVLRHEKMECNAGLAEPEINAEIADGRELNAGRIPGVEDDHPGRIPARNPGSRKAHRREEDGGARTIALKRNVVFGGGWCRAHDDRLRNTIDSLGKIHDAPAAEFGAGAKRVDGVLDCGCVVGDTISCRAERGHVGPRRC